VSVMVGWVHAVLCVLFSYNSIVSASTVFYLSARLYFHSLCHAPILVHTFFSSALFHNCISSSHSRWTVPRLLFCSVIHCWTHLFESFFFSHSQHLSFSYLPLFVSHSPAELPDWSNMYS